jgi:hypothetical protein
LADDSAGQEQADPMKVAGETWLIGLGKIGDDNVLLVSLGGVKGVKADTLHLTRSECPRFLELVQQQLVLPELRSIERKQQDSHRVTAVLPFADESVILKNERDLLHDPTRMHLVAGGTSNLADPGSRQFDQESAGIFRVSWMEFLEMVGPVLDSVGVAFLAAHFAKIAECRRKNGQVTVLTKVRRQISTQRSYICRTAQN